MGGEDGATILTVSVEIEGGYGPRDIAIIEGGETILGKPRVDVRRVRAREIVGELEEVWCRADSEGGVHKVVDVYLAVQRSRQLLEAIG